MRKYHVNYEAFTKEDDTSFYLLGYYMTDGCLETNATGKIARITMSSLDKELLLKLQHLLCPEKSLELSADNRSYRFRFTNDTIADWLVSYGCNPRKSHSLQIEKNIPKQRIPDFLRGCIDGDGSISTYDSKWKNKDNTLHARKKLHVHITSASKAFIIQIASLIPDGIDYNLTTYSAGNTSMHRINFCDRHAQQLLAWVYYLDHKLSMKRKYDSVKEFATIQFGRRKRTKEECNAIHYLQSIGLKSQQIANQLGIPRPTVWTIMNRCA